MTVETMTQQWGPVTHRKTEIVDRDVKLVDAPDITYLRRKTGSCVTGRPYSINFRFGRVHDGPWTPTITIYALRPGSLVGDSFAPDKVADMPDWLADLITEATPA